MSQHKLAKATLIAVVASVAACEDILVSGPLPESGNVAVTISPSVVQTDTGVVVNGQWILSHPRSDESLWVDRFERYDLGGFPELDYPQDASHHVSWRVSLTHARTPVEKGDSTILSYFDHGDATVAGVAMEKLTDLPHFGPSAPPIRFENFIRYIITPHVRVEWMHGGVSEPVNMGFQQDLRAGGPITVATTGSAEMRPVEATFATRPMARLTGIENGEPLQLSGAVPTVDVEKPLVLAFDRPLDPARSFVIVHPMRPNLQPGSKAAFIRTQAPAQRMVVPPHVLRQLVEDAAERTAFRAIIVDIDVQTGVFTGESVDGEAFSLPFVQRAETAVHLYLRR